MASSAEIVAGVRVTGAERRNLPGRVRPMTGISHERATGEAPMTITAIKREHTSLKQKGVDLGAAVGPEEKGFGGRFQQYERGRIYYHMFTGAHGLWGRILERYLQGGGAGPGAGGTRELGFPKSGNQLTADGLYGCARFERGCIVDFPGTPLVRIFGTPHAAWKRLKGELGSLGHPVSDPLEVSGGTVGWFERGLIWHPRGRADVLIGEIVAPTLGQPAIVDPRDLGTFRWVRFSGKTSYLTSVRGLVDALFQGRLKLVAVGAPPAQVPLEPSGLVRKSGERWLQLSIPTGRAGSGRFRHLRETHGPLDLPRSRNPDMSGPGGSPTTVLEDRRLYDLGIAIAGQAPVTISPHCLYARNDWASFGIAHVTDLHVSRRVDQFRATLRAAGVAEADLAEFNNCNDRLRDFIRYANHLHAAGLLDVIIATGDIVDYVREESDAPAGPGNFGILEAILRGRYVSPDPESPPVEELHVPIFTSLGNHDYRGLAYPLVFVPYARPSDIASDFVVRIPYVGGVLATVLGAADSGLIAAPGLGIALLRTEKWVKENLEGVIDALWNHKPFNLVRSEATILMGKKSGGQYLIPALRPKEAAPAVLVDQGMARGTHSYFRRINRDRSYVIALGGHRIVMLDTRWDDGIVTGAVEAVTVKFFGELTPEGKQHFVGGSPDSVGVRASELGLVRQALREADATGAVIVGMHAPPLCTPGGEQPICLRETVHPTNDASQVEGFLRRREVFRAGSDRYWPFSGTRHFHNGTLEEGLDDGTAVGVKDRLAELFAGRGMARPVNLVVSGHGHRRMEFRLRWNSRRRQLETYSDYYLSTPLEFYPTHVVEGGVNDRRYLTRIDPNAPPQGTKHHVTDPNGESIWPDLSWIAVPPYADPLSETRDEAAWWATHSPVVTQTAALGPHDNTRVSGNENPDKPGPNHQGFRMILIRENVIRRVHYVSMDELRRGYPLTWESGRTPPTPPAEPPVGPGISARTRTGRRREVMR